MPREYSKKIKRYYSRKDVVKEYDFRRFRGPGGRYIEKNEVECSLLILARYLKPKPLVRVLDIGAGRGRLSLPLSKKGYEVYCLDSSPEMVRILKKLFPEKRIFLQSAFEIISRNIEFDAVVALRFFDHFKLSDQKKILSNSLINLKTGGYIVFCALNRNSIEYFLSKFLYFGKVNFYYYDSEYKKMVESLELRVVDFDSGFFLPRGVFLYSQSVPVLTQILIRIDIFLNKLMPRRSALLVYLLRK